MRFFHFNVVCSDFDRSYDFYTQAVGMTALTSSRAGTAEGSVRSGASRAGMRPGEGRPQPGDGPEIAALLGFRGSGEYRGCFLYFGSNARGPYIDLLEWKDNAPPVERTPRNVGLSRVCIEVENMEGHLARLARHGVPLVTEPKEFVLGVTRVRVVCFRDPDGVLLEYLEYAGKAWGAST